MFSYLANSTSLEFSPVLRRIFMKRRVSTSTQKHVLAVSPTIHALRPIHWVFANKLRLYPHCSARFAVVCGGMLFMSSPSTTKSCMRYLVESRAPFW